MKTSDVETVIKQYSKLLSVSEAKLRCVYLRGIRECSEGGLEGSPTMYGMARMQRFVSASQGNNTRLTEDYDLLDKTVEFETVTDESTYNETAMMNLELVMSLLQDDGKEVAKIFSPAITHSYCYDEDEQSVNVFGDLDGKEWEYTLHLETGETNFSIQD